LFTREHFAVFLRDLLLVSPGLLFVAGLSFSCFSPSPLPPQDNFIWTLVGYEGGSDLSAPFSPKGFSASPPDSVYFTSKLEMSNYVSFLLKDHSFNKTPFIDFSLSLLKSSIDHSFTCKIGQIRDADVKSVVLSMADKISKVDLLTKGDLNFHVLPSP
jgi:hypothetical protein